MARTGWGRHTVVATGSNDATKQVSVNAWNNDLDTDGLLGFTKQAGTIATGAIVPTGSVIEVQADGTLSTLTPTNNNEFDLIYLVAKSTATSVTIDHDASGGAGKIRLLSGGDETLSTTTPMILMCRTIGGVKEWSQYGGGIVNALGDIGDVVITSVGNEDVLAYDSTTSKLINQTADETGSVTASSTTTFSNKSIDLTDNTLTGTSLELKTAISDETGSGELVFATSPTLVTPALGTPASGVLTNCTALPAAQVAQGTMASGMVLVAPALGTPASGVATNLTGTAASLTAGNATLAATVTTNANLTGDVTSSGNATTIAAGAVDIAMLSATGSAGATTFLRGDGSWQTAGGGAHTEQEWTVYDPASFTPTPAVANTEAYMYTEEIDSDNDGLFIQMWKNGASQAVQIA